MSASNKSKTATSNTLTEQLAYLKLPFILQQYNALAKQAVQDQWGHVDYLARLVEGEALDRQQRSHWAAHPTGSLPGDQNPGVPSSGPGHSKINRLQVQNLFRLKFVEDKANVIILGGVGLGKTHLATALGHAACSEGALGALRHRRGCDQYPGRRSERRTA